MLFRSCVGNTEQHLAQLGLGDVKTFSQALFALTQFTATRLQVFGGRNITISASLTNLLRQLVHLSTNSVALDSDVTQLFVESDRRVELMQHFRVATAGQSSAHRFRIVAEKSDVDHRTPRLPVSLWLHRGQFLMGSLVIVNVEAGNPYNRIDRAERTLVVEDLCVRYGDLIAVDSVSFSARAGEVTAVLGPNGAGKTSTIEVCEGLRKRTSGRVSVLGLDPQHEQRALASQMGIMLQEGGIYPSARPIDVVRQYCGLYSTDTVDRPDELLERVGLSERRRTPWRRLSGGEKQRLSLALALTGQPAIIFLDEPTSGVDVNGRTMIRDIIRDLADMGCAVILATHELDEAEKVCEIGRAHV